MWSIGCLFAEIALGEPLFNGESEVEQLFKIFNFVGAPSVELFNEKYKISDEASIKLPNWERIHFGHSCQDPGSEEFKHLVNSYIPGREQSLYKLMELKGKLGKSGMDLLWRLLDLDPNNRITAAEAIKHEYFQNQEVEIDVDGEEGIIKVNKVEINEHIQLLK